MAVRGAYALLAFRVLAGPLALWVSIGPFALWLSIGLLAFWVAYVLAILAFATPANISHPPHNHDLSAHFLMPKVSAEQLKLATRP